MINNLIKLLKEHDLDTYHHCLRVAELASNIVKTMHYPEKEQRIAYYCGLLHDIGKLKVKTRILTKPAELNSEEWRAIREHPIFGFQLLTQASPVFKDLKYKVLFHRERIDGSGYPFQLKKDDIPFISRIVAVADSFDAMTRERVYRQAKSEAAAFDHLRYQRGISYDPKVIDALQQYLENQRALKQTKTLNISLV